MNKETAYVLGAIESAIEKGHENIAIEFVNEVDVEAIVVGISKENYIKFIAVDEVTNEVMQTKTKLLRICLKNTNT